MSEGEIGQDRDRRRRGLAIGELADVMSSEADLAGAAHGRWVERAASVAVSRAGAGRAIGVPAGS
jgi:hypothetical protein